MKNLPVLNCNILIVAVFSIFLMMAPNEAHSLDSPCSEGGLVPFKTEVYKIAGDRRPEDAWKLAHALLCEKGETAANFVYDRMEEKPADAPEEYIVGSIDTVQPYFKSKEINSEFIADYLTKGEAYLASVSEANICREFDWKSRVLKNCVYPNSVEIWTETGRNNGSIGWTYYISFKGENWVFIGIHNDPD